MTMTPEELAEIARDPAKATQDGRSAEQHSLRTLLELQRALQSDEAQSQTRSTVNGRPMSQGGIRTSTFYPMD
jgi:hypothetical protein